VLTQRMLAFARKQELSMEAVELPALVRGMTGMLQRSLGPTVQIETRFPLGLPPLYTDPAQLETVLLNLTVNARDAMPDGGTISIEAKSETIPEGAGRGLAPGAYVRLSVTDTGQGMSEETLARAAEPFYTTKGVGKGTGLGLAMVRGLAEQSGGTVTIDSAVGIGTTVTLWMPATSETALEATAAIAPPAAAAGEGRMLKILVVDDDFLVAMNTSAMLEDLGHDVVEVHSGALALDALDVTADFDLMITDQAMPQMTGMQLVDAARQKFPDLCVILATGYAELPAGSDQSIPRLSKPFLQADLERILAQVAPRS
jgi:CheY-like chemotaxis protein